MSWQQRLRSRHLWAYIGVFLVAVVLTAGVAALLMNIQTRRLEATQTPLRVLDIPEDEINPEVWGINFPLQYERFQMTQIDYGPTPYGGSHPYSKLERYPVMETLWDGYAFSVAHDVARGHHYAQIDQRNSPRVQQFQQPGACVNCHAAEAPQLIADMGWETFNRTPYDELKDELHLGSSCSDCHAPDTMELRITRPALLNALEVIGVDIEQASRQEMRSYVCAQCHVEYYFLGEDRVLTFPWSQGLNIDDIEAHFDEYEFTDWTHGMTGAPMIKIQHPEFEMWSTGLHARSGVACADCHMPYIRQGSQKISDHWIRSPLVNLENACQTCHNVSEDNLRERVAIIQNNTAEMLHASEEALVDAIDAIVAARAAGATDEDLDQALYLHRSSQLRWDFVSSENSMGFHSPQEAARILSASTDKARQAELIAWRVRVELETGTSLSSHPARTTVSQVDSE